MIGLTSRSFFLGSLATGRTNIASWLFDIGSVRESEVRAE